MAEQPLMSPVHGTYEESAEFREDQAAGNTTGHSLDRR